jgi:hypothetical protein
MRCLEQVVSLTFEEDRHQLHRQTERAVDGKDTGEGGSHGGHFAQHDLFEVFAAHRNCAVRLRRFACFVRGNIELALMDFCYPGATTGARDLEEVGSGDVFGGVGVEAFLEFVDWICHEHLSYLILGRWFS